MLRAASRLTLALTILLPFWPCLATMPPNLVVILTDDLGYGDLGCYGATKVKTPHLDRLASQGCRFTDAHSTASVCTPTRYAFLTGRYAWRQPGTGIAAGNAPALIPAGTTTVASLLKSAGYTTGLVGKWHLGLGDPPTTDFNGDIKPGPLELGFDYAFFIPATGDRVPCVFVENHRVVSYDPGDPIRVSYGTKIGDEPTGNEPDVKLKIQGGPGHKDTVVNGIPRIGFMTGGQAARWVDEDIADTLATKAVKFIESHQSGPFFLYLAPHDIHEPMVPHPRFRGTSDCGWRGDVIHQLDWTVGEVLAALDRLKLASNTLVLFTSDNGGALKNTYDDGTNPLHARQPPNGTLRGSKGSLYEGGHRVPFLARWPGRIASGSTSGQLIAHVDILATFAALTGQKLAPDAAPDSFNVLPALLGEKPTQPVRDHLVLQNNGPAPLALRENDWVLIRKGGGGPPQRQPAPTQGEPKPTFELFNLAVDPAQTNNLVAQEVDRVKAMSARLETIRRQGHTRPQADSTSP
jgi:arylsulfatase A-like enzyme